MAFFNAFKEEARKVYGDRLVGSLADADSNMFGVELPSFALRYLFGSNILPMSKIIGAAGAAASFKSAFGFWIMRLVAESLGGNGDLIETENKLNPEYMGSIVGHDRIDREAGVIAWDSYTTVEDAQDRLSFDMRLYKDNCPDRDTAFCIGVDSLGSPASEDEMKEMEKTGHASKSYPAAALLWTKYFKKISNDLVGMPIIVFFTNHLKDKIDAQAGFGEKPKTKQGGVSQDFHAMHYFYFSRVADIRQASREGALVKIQAYKSGMCPRNRKVEVPILWHMEGEAGNKRQITNWDWHAATAKLLVDKHLPPETQQVSDVRVASNRYSSKRLELVNVEDTAMGEAVYNDKEYMAELCDTLVGYKNWKVWAPPAKEEPKAKGRKRKAAQEEPSAEPSTEPSTMVENPAEPEDPNELS